MTDALHAAAVLPNRESATGCSAEPIIGAVMRAAHSIFRHQTGAQLRAITKASPRTVSYWMSRRTPGMTVENLVALMRAEPAHFVPAALGADAYRVLARAIVAQAKLEELTRQQDEQGRLIERLKRRRGG